MGRYLRALANLSPAKLGSAIAAPWRIPILLTGPSAQSNSGAILSLFPDLSPTAVEACLLEFLRNNRFFSELNSAYVERRHRRATCGGWNEFLYMAVRFARPQTVVETGVFDGCSSAVILQALSDNGSGRLISIDLPATDTIEMSTHRMRETTLPPGCQPGWVIPDYLREQHRLVFGDSREVLPSLLDECPQIDIFFHDSLHTFEHQYFEYSTAWPALSEEGLLLSDDIHWSAAFHKFCRQVGKRYVRLNGFGAVRK